MQTKFRRDTDRQHRRQTPYSSGPYFRHLRRLALPLAFFVSAIVLAVAVPAYGWTHHGCKYDSGVTPSITYKYHSMETAYKNAFTTAQSEWDKDTGYSTTYFTTTTGGDPNIDVYDGSYAGSWSAQTSWSCWWIVNTYVGDEVAIKFNKNHMDGTSTRGKWVTASHELGHALGLGHVSMTCSYAKVMEQGTEKYGCSGNPPWTDDINGWENRY
jgi:hypothetical protein